MKIKNIIQVSILAGVMGLCYACSSGESELNEVTSDVHASRGADVEATVTLETAGTLETVLKEAYGDDVANIAKLSITGLYNAADHSFIIESIKDLHTLDMKNATIVGNDTIGFKGMYGYIRYLSDNSIASGMFSHLSTLKTLIFPDNLEKIEDYGCSNLLIKSIDIPESVTSIGYSAFSTCEELAEVKIKANVDSIPSNCFNGCLKLSKIEIPSTVEAVRFGAFKDCALTDFTPFENVKSFGTRAFERCDFKELILSDKVTKMDTEVFIHNDSLTTVEFSCNLSSVPEHTFEGCVNLSNVSLATSIESVGGYAFDGCGSLTDYSPFAHVKEIGVSSFSKCGFLELKLPEGVTTIGDYAFAHCYSLRTVTIPKSITTIGNSFMQYCVNVTSVFWNAAINVEYDYTINPNVLLYLTDENIKVNNYNGSWKNIIVNGVANNITLSEGRRYHCPQEFLAKKISYTKKFNLTTSIGGNEGWETIVLPFVPTAYTHKDKGVIAPFDSEINTKKYFWLRELMSDGFVDVTVMESHKPYIISMPNSYDYADDYNLNGDITFSAENVTVAVTPEPLESVVGPGFALQPVYVNKETSVSVYSLNVSKLIDSYGKGSVFAHSLDRAVQPFEAYAFLTDSKSSRRARVINISKYASKSRTAIKKNTSGIPQKSDMAY